MAGEDAHELHILEQIERHPDSTQADMATHLGVAIGTVNWYLKRMIGKGFVKVAHVQRRRLRYLITPAGMSEKARLAYEYVQISMNLYRTTRRRVAELIQQLKEAGDNEVVIEGDGDLADICRLTCIEQGVRARPSSGAEELPALVISGTSVYLQLAGTRQRGASG